MSLRDTGRSPHRKSRIAPLGLQCWCGYFAIPILHKGQVKPERVRSHLKGHEGWLIPEGAGSEPGPETWQEACGSGGQSRALDSPVDEVIFLQVLAAAGNVPSHVQEVQHGQGGGLVLWGDGSDPLLRSARG